MRIGIDVGGTNTDAVLMEGPEVVAKHKTPTTADVSTGIITALRQVIAGARAGTERIQAVMIGTTHFTNAVVERKRLMPVAAIRLGLPATAALPPMVDWPEDLRDTIGAQRFLVHGGHEFDGRVLSAFQENEVRDALGEVRRLGIRSVAISSVFSPVNAEMEERAGALAAEELPEAFITLSQEIGRLGLLERENAGIMNAALRDLASRIVRAFREALAELRIEAPFYLSQNDGTLMSAEFAERYPVLTFASGPTNSMRGAAFLSGVKDGMVVDIGGTTSDVGMLVHGFPREASAAVEIGGVRTNFRMPDVYSFGLGGGSLIRRGPLRVGPDSVGYELTEKALVFGGETTTATDLAVAGGLAEIGELERVGALDRTLVAEGLALIQTMIETAVDRMKTSLDPIPVVLVGGGSILVSREIAGASGVIKPPHFEAANAIGAAIAQVGGEVDRVFALEGSRREDAIAQAKDEAQQKAVAAGAAAGSVHIVDVEEVPLTYLPSNAVRIRVKAVGDLAM